MDNQQSFINNLPSKPYCSNNLAEGLKIRTKNTAVKHKYIQHNHPEWITCIVFDIDRNAYEILEDTNCKPNIAIFNAVERDRAHFMYRLSQPISKTEKSRQKPIQFLEAIKESMTVGLKADPFFRHFIIKTPYHPDHITHDIRQEPYDLNELADYFDLSVKPSKQLGQRLDASEGRNNTVFEKLRMIAYKTVMYYRNKQDLAGFQGYLWNEADTINCQFDQPLQQSEIKWIVKSVSKWTYYNFKPKNSKNGKLIDRGRDKEKTAMLSDLKDRQVYSAIITNKQRVETTQSKIKTAVRRLLARGEKITQKAVAEQAGLGIATVKRHKNLLK